jgi:uncharacterized protein YjbI with pentapeptide repeats
MAMDLEIIKNDKAAPRSKAARPAKIELELLLETHREWVQSGGRKGRQADLSRLNLEGADLTDTNLRNARLNDTVLKGADLLLSDLEGASLLQANLEGANLLGARLREANLQGANLKGATGLLAAELSGTNLTFAKLPTEISTAEDLKYLARRGRHANWLILSLLLLNVLACWRILTVSDAQILRNASSLPLASRRNELPLVQFFLFCPVLLGGLYLWLHVYLQRLWEATAALPAIFENGRGLDASLPWLVRWPAHSYFRWLRERRSALAGIEKATCMILLYWAAPATMLLFWARYLTLQDVRGTILHILLITAAVSAAIYFPRSTARAFGSDASGWPAADSAAADAGEAPSPRRSDSVAGSISGAGRGGSLRTAPGGISAESTVAVADLPLRSSVPVDEAVAELLQSTEADSSEPLEAQPRTAAKPAGVWRRIPLGVAFGFILLLLAIGTIGGAPHNGNAAQGIGPASPRTWAADAFWLIGYDPFAQVNETEISRKPEGWTGSEDQLGRAEGAGMNGIRLRYLQGYSAFLAKARLRQADLRYAYLSEADLRQANLRGASLRFAVLERARLDNASLQSADLAHANLIRASLEKADLSFASLAGTLLLDAKADGAVLYGADLHNASLERAALGQADLREADLEGANLSGSDLHEAYLSSVKMAGAKLDQARLGGAILMSADLRRVDLSASNFQSAVLTGADLTGSNLQNADLRGVVGLRASQLCSAANIRGAQLDDALAADVAVQCPGSR